MDAAPLAKSAKVLIVASSLIAASTTFGAAQDAPIALGTPAAISAIPLSSWYVGPPAGSVTLGGHAFDLSSGNLLQLGNGQTISYSGSYANFKAAYLLLNTSNTYVMWYDQAVVGNVVLTFSDGTTQSTDLTVGGNIREWRPALSTTVNDVLPGSGSAPVWTGTAQDGMGGGTAVLDMLTIPAATAGKTLTGVTLNDTNTFGALHIQLAGLTVDYAPVIPTPAPTCTKKNQDAGHWADKTKHLEHCVAKTIAKAERETENSTDAGQRNDD
jgi:hypothetical protein